MNEQLVIRKTAELAKQLCLPQEVDSHNQYYHPWSEYPDYYEWGRIEPDDNVIFAPTQSFLQKWVRDEYKFHITIIMIDGSFGWCIQSFTEDDPLLCSDTNVQYETYEDALEKALYTILEKILLDER